MLQPGDSDIIDAEFALTLLGKHNVAEKMGRQSHIEIVDRGRDICWELNSGKSLLHIRGVGHTWSGTSTICLGSVRDRNIGKDVKIEDVMVTLSMS